MKQNGEPLMKAYGAVEEIVNEVSAYVRVSNVLWLYSYSIETCSL